MIVDSFLDSLEKGLAEDGQTVPMIPTYVMGWPTGKEVGPYLAVDLGGTNLRVCHVELEGDGRFEVTQTKYKMLVSTSLSLARTLLNYYGNSRNQNRRTKTSSRK